MKKITSMIKIMYIVFCIVGVVFAVAGLAFLLRAIFSAGLFGGVYIAMGITMIIFGGVMIAISVFMNKKNKSAIEQIGWLKDNGAFVEAQLISCEQDSENLIKGKPSYIVKAKYEAPNGQIYIYSQEGIAKNPAEKLKDKKIYILCAKDDYSRYYMDIENDMNPEMVGM